MGFPPADQSGLRPAEHQPDIAAYPDPTGQEGEGPCVHARRGEGHAEEAGIYHAGKKAGSFLEEKEFFHLCHFRLHLLYAGFLEFGCAEIGKCFQPCTMV